jgi:hypothetical protein
MLSNLIMTVIMDHRELLQSGQMTTENEKLPLCHVCGKKEYDIGCHGIKDGEVMSTYWCEKCWNDFKCNRYKTKEE